MTAVALMVGGPEDGKRVAISAHNPYFAFPVLAHIPIRSYYEDVPPKFYPTTQIKYVQTGVRVGDQRVYVYEPLLNAEPYHHATEIAFQLLMEGYRVPLAR